MARGGRGPTVLTTPSRFVTEIEDSLVECAEIEEELDLDHLWSGASPSGGRTEEGRSWFAE
jgi:hypothetical protein